MALAESDITSLVMHAHRLTGDRRVATELVRIVQDAPFWPWLDLPGATRILTRLCDDWIASHDPERAEARRLESAVTARLTPVLADGSPAARS